MVHRYEKEAILVTGVGGAAGISTIRALKLTGKFKIIGVDANPLSAGFKFCDEFYKVPYASDKYFVDYLLELSEKKKVAVLIPTVDEELLVIARNREKFERIGTKVLVADEEALVSVLDKYLSYQKLGKALFARTWTLDEFMKDNPLSFPVIIKPRLGRGSRNTHMIENIDELHILARKVRDPIVQEYLEEPEYSVDVLSDLSGKAIIAIPRKRLEIKAGVTWRGIIDLRKDIMEVSKKVAQYFKLAGLSCIQLRFKDGKPKVFEVNPRIGGTSILSVYAGVNIPLLAVKIILGEPIDTSFSIKKVMVVRYFEEAFFETGA